MCIDTTLSLTGLITTVVAAGGLIVAIIGLSTWKKQLRGTSDYELAKRLMLEVYQLRDALRSTRNPFLSPAEGNEDDTGDSWEITAYGNRWKLVREVITRFQVTSLEAEVIWGDTTKKPNKEMHKLISKLNVALHAFARMKKSDKYADDFYKLYDDVIYDKGDDDEYNVALNNVVQSYETALKHHFRK